MGRLRSSEWLLIIYFSYVAFISPAFSLPGPVAWRPFAVALLVAGLLVAFAYGEAREYPETFSIARDWLAVALVLVAYREMDWFGYLSHDYHLEMRWIEWDRWFLYKAGMQHAIESLGALVPLYLELCYLLVYAVGPFAVAVLYFERRRDLVNALLGVYLLGTLLSYALFPYFPSDPPRLVFGGSDMPNVVTAVRRFNLWIVNGYGIHSSVFPSAHVSSAFSAAWALLLLLPAKKRLGLGMLIYALSVSVATVYGRYHYLADVVAGFWISVVAGIAGALAIGPQMNADKRAL
ncbi:MAG TPA: phosphatase PAP2 family protein [Bryobacteraceae bacterium]|nr:phosphatase PAP2 family protein [Bryobacteraceae bacterium]